jgi:hypothetical protein
MSTTPTAQPQLQQHAQGQLDAQRVLHGILSHPTMTLEAKVDTFKKLRQDNKITEQMFQHIVCTRSFAI